MKIFPDDQRVGLGGAPLVGLFTPTTEAEATATVQAAWDEGWRYFDTAPHYGLGLAEERLGAGLDRAKVTPSPVKYTVVSRPGT